MNIDHSPLYEKLVSFISEMIDVGTIKPGDRVPSLREISQQQRISLSTALRAYRLLEDRGVLEAHPKSGYFVSKQTLPLEVPAISKPARVPTRVSMSSRVLELLELSGDQNFVPLGCAIPSAKLLSAHRLDRFLSKASRQKGGLLNQYTVPKGEHSLRQEIARRGLSWGLGLSPEDIAITCGCTEALVLALKAITNPGDIVAVESPTYFGLLQVIESLKLKALELPTAPESGVDMGSLKNAIEKKKVKVCLFASSFNNPLGCSMSEEKKREVLELLWGNEVLLVEDDIYGDVYFGEQKPKPFIALDKYGITTYCSSFSKTLSPGYRVGWIIPGQHMQTVLEQKISLTLSGNVLAQVAVSDYLAAGGYDNHLRQLRKTFHNNIYRMRQAIKNSFPTNTKVTNPAGGFVLWVELPEDMDCREVFTKALKKNICFAPGDVFTAGKRYQNCLRISCGHEWNDNIERGISELGQLFKADM